MRRLHLLLVLGLPACASSSVTRGGQTGEENFGCVAIEERPLGPDDVSPIGVTPGDVRALMAGPHEAALRWSAGDGTTAAHLAFSGRESAPRFIREAPRDGRELALDCRSYVAVTTELAFRTDDGAFDESWPTVFRAETPERGEVYVRFDWDALGGTYDFTPLVPAEHTVVDGSAAFTFDASATPAPRISGTISGLTERQRGDAVGAEYVEVGKLGD